MRVAGACVVSSIVRENSPAKNGASIRDADVYVTHTPCIHCLKVLINTGIRRVYFEREYKRQTLDELLRDTDVRLECVAP